GLPNKSLDILHAPDIRRHTQDVATRTFPDLIRRRFEYIGASGADRHVGAFANEFDRSRLPDAFATTGNERRPSVELQVHDSPSLSVSLCRVVLSLAARSSPRSPKRPQPNRPCADAQRDAADNHP